MACLSAKSLNIQVYGNKVHVIKELLNVKYNSATVYVLDLAHIVFSIETSCIE